jgi:hypothetical protein
MWPGGGYGKLSTNIILAPELGEAVGKVRIE